MVLEVRIFFQLIVDPVNKGQLLLHREAVGGAWRRDGRGRLLLVYTRRMADGLIIAYVYINQLTWKTVPQ